MIRKLAKSIRQYKKDTIICSIFTLLEVTLEIIIPLFTAGLIDKGVEPGVMGQVIKYGVLILVFAAVQLVFGIIGGITSATSSAGFCKNLRQDVFYKVQTFSFANIDKFSSASIVTRLTTDVSNIQFAFQQLIRIAVRSPLMLIFALIVCINISPKLSLVYLAVMPVLFGALYLILRLSHPVFERVFKKYDDLNAVVQEDLRGIRVVKTFTREPYETKKFKTASNEIFKDFSKAESILAFNSPIMQFSVYVCIILIAWIGAHLIVASGNAAPGFTTGELTSLLTYTMQILMSLMMVSQILVTITICRASAERIVEILDEESSITSPEDACREVSDGSIRFDNVSFSYSGSKERLALKNINLDIKSGETIGILGGTGSAKSSLVQLIPRLYDTSEGTVYVGGKDVRSYDLYSLRETVSMVLQKNVLFSGSIKENLRWGKADATDEEIVHACKLACADEFITTFPDGYDTFIEQGGSNVSGGQRQRLCIARALLKNPKILILDDSTSAVDTKTDAMIRKAFAEEIPDTTKIIIAQRVASVQDADKIIVMDNGRIVDIGTHDELLKTSTIYREVFESQLKGDDSNG